MNIINIYDNYDNLYYIGGVVRDKLLGIKSFDIDITYIGNAIEHCSQFGEVLRENPEFGTVRVKVAEDFFENLSSNKSLNIIPYTENQIIDFASTRCEIYDKKGHLPKVTKIGCSLKEDVLRRDFTINAMAMSLKTGEIIDYTGGQKDLKNKILRVLHDESFTDDPTRILRGLKFRIRFGFNLELKTRELQQKYLSNINYDMSYKRIKKELVETFNLNSQKAFEIFVHEDIYKLISPQKFELPKVNIEEVIKKYLLTQNVKTPHIWLVYAGLLPDLSKLELTKEERKILDDFKNIKIPKSDFEIYKTFNGLEPESILLYGITNEMNSVERYFDILNKIHLSVTGKDLKTLGITPSFEYQNIFDEILREKLKNPQMSHEDELTIAKKYL